MSKRLLDGQYHPITSTIGFLECSPEHAAQTFLKWRERTYARDGRSMYVDRFEEANLASAFDLLLPLKTWENRWLFIETQSNWCAYVDNGFRGTDDGPMSSLAKNRVKCRAMRVTSAPANKVTGEMYACIWALYNPAIANIQGTERSVWAVDDGGRWDFGTIGEPFPFERIEQYSARRKRDRFTHEMLDEYLRHFGIRAFDESFYQSPSGCRGYLVHVEGPLLPGNEEHSLPGNK